MLHHFPQLLPSNPRHALTNMWRCLALLLLASLAAAAPAEVDQHDMRSETLEAGAVLTAEFALVRSCPLPHGAWYLMAQPAGS